MAASLGRVYLGLKMNLRVSPSPPEGFPRRDPGGYLISLASSEADGSAFGGAALMGVEVGVCCAFGAPDG